MIAARGDIITSPAPAEASLILREQLTAAELEQLELPGLPGSERRIRDRADREGWQFVERAARGGGRAFLVTSLPAQAQAEIARRRRIAQARLTPPAPRERRGRGRPKGTDFFTRNPMVADAVDALIANTRRPAPVILDILRSSFGQEETPSLPQLRRYIARAEREQVALLASLRDPDCYKSRYRVALGRADGSLTHAHQRWEIDTTKADVITRGGRKMVLGVVDVWSRRVRFMVCDSESGQSVRRLLVETIIAWGAVPEQVATDNGSGFINVSIVSALEALGIDHAPCLPGTPEDKPFVERVFGTFTRARAGLLKGFAGHSVADAQRIRARAKKESGRAVIVPELEPERLQAIIDGWVDGTYHVSTHSSIGTSPMARWMTSPVPAREAPSADVLKMALSAFVGPATVGKKGVRWKRGSYWCEALVPFMGRSVIVRRDEEDLGALFIFDEDGRYVGTAVNHERAGVSEAEFAAIAKAHQDGWMRDARAQVRAKQKAFNVDEAIDRMLRDEAQRAGKLIALPKPVRPHSTPAIESLRDAGPAAPTADEVAAIAAKMAARAKPAAAPVFDAPAKVAAADAIIAAADRGEPVDEAELKRARLYATSTEYRAQKMVSASFARPAAARDASPSTTTKGQVA